jgi:hypothetical protein
MQGSTGGEMDILDSYVATEPNEQHVNFEHIDHPYGPAFAFCAEK